MYILRVYIIICKSLHVVPKYALSASVTIKSDTNVDNAMRLHSATALQGRPAAKDHRDENTGIAWRINREDTTQRCVRCARWCRAETNFLRKHLRAIAGAQSVMQISRRYLNSLRYNATATRKIIAYC